MGLRGAPVTVPFDEICFKELRVRSGFAANPLAWLPRHAPARRRRGPARAADQRQAVELADFARAFARSRAADGVKFVLVP